MSTTTPAIDALEQLLRNDAALQQAARASAAAEEAATINRIREASALQRLRDSGAIRPPTPVPAAPLVANPAVTPINAVPNRIPGGFSSRLGRVGGIVGAIGLVFTLATEINRFRDLLRDPSDYWRRQNEALASGWGMPPEMSCALLGVGCQGQTEQGIPFAGNGTTAPLFHGGQFPGVRYRVRFSWTVIHPEWAPSTGSVDHIFSGPIHSMGIRLAGPTARTQYEVYVRHGEPATDNVLGGGGTWNQFQHPRTVQATGFQVNRVDGQPDTGGNPAPLPGTPTTIPAPLHRNPIGNPTLPQPDRRLAAPPAIVPAPNPTNPATQPVGDLQPTPTLPPSSPLAPPTAPPEAPPSEPEAPPENGNRIPWWAPLLGVRPDRPIGTSSRINQQSNPQPNTNNPRTTTGDIPTPTCRYDALGISGKVDRANLAIEAVQVFMQDQMMRRLDAIDAKLGPQLPSGGISGLLDKMNVLARKTWDFLQINKVLAVLTWIGVLHNAYMLSNSISQTLFSAISTALDAFGIEDADGEPLDVGEIVGNWTEDFFSNLIGEETVDGIKAGWAKYNRIYQAATNILYSVQSMVYSMVEILEVISNYTGRIGNALLRSGTILAGSFNWMNTNFNYLDNRFFRFLQRVQDGTELIEQIFSEVVSIQDTGAELFEQSEQFNRLISESENEEKLVEDAARAAQKRPNLVITPNDELPAEVEE